MMTNNIHIKMNYNKSIRIRIIVTAVNIGLLLFCTPLIGSEEKLVSLNKMKLDQEYLNSDQAWMIELKKRKDGNFTVLLKSVKTNVRKLIWLVSKPGVSFEWFYGNIPCLLLKCEVGFTTQILVVTIPKNGNHEKCIFDSTKTNLRPFVDYLPISWNNKGNWLNVQVVENQRYLEGRDPRNLSLEFIYLDGLTRYD
jgi:hypothetical protein